MEWQGLEFLGAATVNSLRELFGNPVHLANSFDGPEGAASLVRQLVANTGENLLEDEAARRLVEWADTHQRAFKRVKREMATGQVAAPIRVSQQCDVTCDTYENIVRGDPKVALDLLKKTRKSRRAGDAGGSRAEQEDQERERYAHELACVLNEAGLPVVSHISMLDNPDKAWSRIFGSRRSKTLRNRFRAWTRVRLWLVAYNGQVWPKSVAEMVNFMEDSISMGATISLVNETQAALSVLEQVGRVPDAIQISRDPLWKAHLASWQAEFERKSGPRESAQPYTVAVIISLELFVMDESKDFYKRVIAWAMLVCCWCCMRVDDLQSVLPETLRISTRGMTMRMNRTKTTGAGKIHGHVHAFIERSVGFTGNDWLEEGFNLMRHETSIFPRDYLIPGPNKSWTGFSRKLVQPPQMANFFRMVLQSLGTPKWEDSHWRINWMMERVPGDMSLFWTGHSPRHFLPQAAASIGCPKTDRDFLGRWAIGKSGSNAYLLTSRQIVERIQREVVESCFPGQVTYDESELLDNIREFADKHGFLGSRTRRRHKVLPLKARTTGVLSQDADSVSDEELIPDEVIEATKEVALGETVGDEDQHQGLYFVTISRRTGFRRLHLIGGCHVHAEKCQQTVILNSLDSSLFDAACKVCKSKLKDMASERENSSSSSDGSSSSTQSSDRELNREEQEFKLV